MSTNLNDLVDNVYVLNLERESFKYDIVKRKLNDKNIQHQRFVGVDMRDNSFSLKEKEESFRRMIDQYRGESLYDKVLVIGAEVLFSGYGAFRYGGALGCLLSHIKILEDAIKKKYKKILFLQDDIYFHRDFDTLLDVHAETIRSSAVFYLGATENMLPLMQNKWSDPNWAYRRNKYAPTEKTYGMFGVIVDEGMFESLLKLMKSKFFAADQCLSILASIPKKNALQYDYWVAFPNLIMADTRFSNTFEGVSYSHGQEHRALKSWSQKKGWNLEYYDLSEKYYK
tara:strand:- start:3964 stop:4815 length:852 start_codon:yes stop_codon:yes gene_type:complete